MRAISRRTGAGRRASPPARVLEWAFNAAIEEKAALAGPPPSAARPDLATIEPDSDALADASAALTATSLARLGVSGGRAAGDDGLASDAVQLAAAIAFRGDDALFSELSSGVATRSDLSIQRLAVRHALVGPALAWIDDASVARSLIDRSPLTALLAAPTEHPRTPRLMLLRRCLGDARLRRPTHRWLSSDPGETRARLGRADLFDALRQHSPNDLLDIYDAAFQRDRDVSERLREAYRTLAGEFLVGAEAEAASADAISWKRWAAPLSWMTARRPAALRRRPILTRDRCALAQALQTV